MHEKATMRLIIAEKACKIKDFVRGRTDTSLDRNLAQDKTRSIALKRKNNGCFVIHPPVRSLNPKPSSNLVRRTHHLRLRPLPLLSSASFHRASFLRTVPDSLELGS